MFSVFYSAFQTKIVLAQRLQLLLHGQCVFLVMLLLVLTIVRIRSAYLVMLPILFYTIPVFINAATKLQNNGGKF
jgi:hypothetical protein